MNIEYLGLNISRIGELIEKKIYYHWDQSLESKIAIPLNGILRPFDYAERQIRDGYSYSSYFSISSFDIVMKYVEDRVSTSTAKEIEQFSSIVEEGYNNYDPILSIKCGNEQLEEYSLYVGPLKNKKAMKRYMGKVFEVLDLSQQKLAHEFIIRSIETETCDIFLIAWDFRVSMWRNSQFKIYLKIKRLDDVTELICKYFPELGKWLYIPKYRFNVIAFVFKDNFLSHYNLYFKPN